MSQSSPVPFTRRQYGSHITHARVCSGRSHGCQQPGRLSPKPHIPCCKPLPAFHPSKSGVFLSVLSDDIWQRLPSLLRCEATWSDCKSWYPEGAVYKQVTNWMRLLVTTGLQRPFISWQALTATPVPASRLVPATTRVGKHQHEQRHDASTKPPQSAGSVATHFEAQTVAIITCHHCIDKRPDAFAAGSHPD